MRMTLPTALVLRTIAAGHLYGFDLMDATGLPSGTVYPLLRRLEAAGWLRASWEDAAAAHAAGRPRRRSYRLTARGVAALGEADRRLAEARRRLARAATGPAGGEGSAG